MRALCMIRPARQRVCAEIRTYPRTASVRRSKKSYEFNLHRPRRQTGTHVAHQLHKAALLSIFGKRPREAGMLPDWACHVEDISASSNIPRRSAARHPFTAISMSGCWPPIAAASCSGIFYPDIGTELKPLGDAFIRLVKMIIAPVIFLTVATGIAACTESRQGRPRGRQGDDLLSRLLHPCPSRRPRRRKRGQPGAGMHIPASLDAKAVATYAEKAHEQSITGFLMNIIPTTLVGAFAEGDILQVLFISGASS